jgi:glycosyltransferase involved in cell wall biosynthesis
MSGVIQVITAMQRGGAQKIALETAVRLHAKECPHVLLSGPAAELDAEASAQLGPRFKKVTSLKAQIDPVHDMRAIHFLRRAYKSFIRRVGAPIVVHTHSSKAGILGRFAARGLPQVAVVHTVHGFGVHSQGSHMVRSLIAAERLAAEMTHTLIFVSEADLEQAALWGIGNKSRKIIVRAAIEENRFSSFEGGTKEEAKNKFGIPTKANVAVVVANYKEQKDPFFHVEILREWVRQNTNAHLLFVGDGPLRSETFNRVQDFGLTDHYTSVGELTDVRPALKSADVFLLASQWEGLPCSLLEALASGLPAVFRDTGYGQALTFAESRLASLGKQASASDFAKSLESARLLPRVCVSLPPEFTHEGMLAQLRNVYDSALFAARL